MNRSAQMLRTLLVIAATLALASCGDVGIRYEVDISGAPAEMSAGEENVLNTYVTMYSDGEIVYERARVDPDNVTYTVSNASVATVDTRVSSFGSTVKYLVALAPGRTQVTARTTNGEATNFVDVR